MKHWTIRILKSKTINSASLVAILGAIQLNSDFLSNVLTPNQFGFVMMGIAVLMVVLRGVTTTPLSSK